MRRSLQIKKLITNLPSINNSKNRLVISTAPAWLKKLQKLHSKNMMSFIHSGSEIRSYRVSSSNKLDGIASYIYDSICLSIFISLFSKKCFNAFWWWYTYLLSFLMFLQVVSIPKCNSYPKSKSIFGIWSYRQTMFWDISQEQHYKMIL